MKCLKHLDIEIDYEKLSIEFNESNLVEYKLCDYDDEYFNHVKSWHHYFPDMNEKNSEVKKIVDELNSRAGKEIISHVQFYRLDAESELPMHRDPMRKARCAVNILLDDYNAPITFEEIGDVYYKVALVDVSRAKHMVKAYPKDRRLVKFTISKYGFKDVSKWI